MFPPNWIHTYETPTKIEEKLKGFSYLGPGYYSTKGDLILIEEKSYQKTKVYQVTCWNQSDINQFLSYLASLISTPIRVFDPPQSA